MVRHYCRAAVLSHVPQFGANFGFCTRSGALQPCKSAELSRLSWDKPSLYSAPSGTAGSSPMYPLRHCAARISPASTALVYAFVAAKMLKRPQPDLIFRPWNLSSPQRKIAMQPLLRRLGNEWAITMPIRPDVHDVGLILLLHSKFRRVLASTALPSH